MIESVARVVEVVACVRVELLIEGRGSWLAGRLDCADYWSYVGSFSSAVDSLAVLVACRRMRVMKAFVVLVIEDLVRS